MIDMIMTRNISKLKSVLSVKEAKEQEIISEKVSKLENEVEKLKGTPVEKNYLPANVSPDIAYSEDYLKSQKNKSYKNETDEGSGFLSIIIILLLIGGLGYYLIFVRKY